MYILRSVNDRDKRVSIGIREWPLSDTPIQTLNVASWA
jgi:hypothetical protein